LEESEADALGLPKDRGELVRAVVPGAAADRAGIRQGDVIVRVNGRDVTPDETASFLIANTTVGARIPIEVIRANGRRETVQVTVSQRPTEEQLAQVLGGDDGEEGGATVLPNVPPQHALGLSLQPLTPDLARGARLPATARGVIVMAVDAASDAAEEGIQRGDLIMSVNRQPVSTPAQVAAAVDAARRAGRTSVLLLVKRGPSPEAFVGVEIGAR
jgi:serine protease Do